MVHASAPPFILAQLPPDLQHVLLTCVQIAARQDVQLWLVGGVVRDLLQQRGPTRDLDLAYAGDAPQLCGALAAALGATLLAEHSAFGTATLTVPMPNNAPRCCSIWPARAVSTTPNQPACRMSPRQILAPIWSGVTLA